MVFWQWDDFWWRNITGPRMFVSDVSVALIDGNMVLLSVPADLPWRKTMRRVIHEEFRDRLNLGNLVIEDIDAADEFVGFDEPGTWILDRYAINEETRKGYRRKSCVTIQEYISANNVIPNRLIWVKGLSKKAASGWIEFCRGFGQRSLVDGIFLLEVQGDFSEESFLPMKKFSFRDYVGSDDVQLFCSFVLDSLTEYSYTSLWKKYVANLIANLCDTDAELSKHILETYDLRCVSVNDVLKDATKVPAFLRRGEKPDSEHILWYVRSCDNEHIDNLIWKAQVQVLFPFIELERSKVVYILRDQIQRIIDERGIIQFEEQILSYKEVELGTLLFIMSNRNDIGEYDLMVTDAKLRDRIKLLHRCRNNLAHVSICSTEQVSNLIDYPLVGKN